MARILFSTYMVRYPLGGMLSWAIQYALGFRQLGHEVYLLERANYPGACYDPKQRHCGDDCRANYGNVHELLKRFELEHHLIFQANDWNISDAQKVTDTYDSYHAYISASMGEFSVCKNIFVDIRTGWFSDRSTAYLATWRPVVLQETGFGEHLPCGRGLFAVSTPEEAAAAIDAIMSNYSIQSRGAREIAEEHLDATTFMKQLLS